MSIQIWSPAPSRYSWHSSNRINTLSKFWSVRSMRRTGRGGASPLYRCSVWCVLHLYWFCVLVPVCSLWTITQSSSTLQAVTRQRHLAGNNSYVIHWADIFFIKHQRVSDLLLCPRFVRAAPAVSSVGPVRVLTGKLRAHIQRSFWRNGGRCRQWARRAAGPQTAAAHRASTCLTRPRHRPGHRGTDRDGPGHRGTETRSCWRFNVGRPETVKFRYTRSWRKTGSLHNKSMTEADRKLKLYQY